ncbi:MAG: glycosyltransferase family 4 protein [Aureliella sp.]
MTDSRESSSGSGAAGRPAKIAHVITRMIIGGAQENTLYNCLDLIDLHGDDVVLITGPTEGPEGRLLEEGRAGGLKVVVLPDLQRAISPLPDRRAYRGLQRVIDEFKPDVVHTHSAKGGFLGRAAAWNRRVPTIIHTVHGAPFHPFQSALARKLFIHLERWAARRCHHMICVADAMTELMVGAGVAKQDKFTTIYSGMDVEPFVRSGSLRSEARERLGIQQDEVVVGKIARFFNLKGHEYLIEAAREVLAKNPKCRFLLVGDGVLREEIESKLAAYGIADKFILPGLVRPEDVPYYLSAMDTLVHTSLREGLARTLPQALISGKPVISYDVDGAREVVLDGQTGFLLPPKSVGELAEAILKLVQDSDLRTQMGQEGARRFTEQFRHQFMTRRIREVYTRFGAPRPQR